MGKRLIILLMALIVVAASCKKDSISATKLSAKVDGKNWSTVLRATNLTGDVFIITGTSTFGAILEITVNGKIPGVYNLNLTDLSNVNQLSTQKCYAVYKKSGLSTSSDDFYYSFSGSVTITKVDPENKKLSGTFEFDCKQLKLSSLFETLKITSGSFNDLEYIQTPL